MSSGWLGCDHEPPPPHSPPTVSTFGGHESNVWGSGQAPVALPPVPSPSPSCLHNRPLTPPHPHPPRRECLALPAASPQTPPLPNARRTAPQIHVHERQPPGPDGCSAERWTVSRPWPLVPRRGRTRQHAAAAATAPSDAGTALAIHDGRRTSAGRARREPAARKGRGIRE